MSVDFQNAFTRKVMNDSRFVYRLGRGQMLFSFQLKTRLDLQLYLQEKKEEEGGGYYVMILGKTTSSYSFPPPGQETYHHIREIDEFINRLVQFIHSCKVEVREVATHHDNVANNAEDRAAYVNGPPVRR